MENHFYHIRSPPLSFSIFITHVRILRNGRYANANGIGRKQNKSKNKTTKTTWHAHPFKDPVYDFMILCLFVFFFACQYLCKQFGSRSGLAFVVPYKHMDTLTVFLLEFSKKLFLKNNQQTTKRHKNALLQRVIFVQKILVRSCIKIRFLEYISINSYGHVGTVSSTNHTYLLICAHT